jgi:hypothetical protein
MWATFCFSSQGSREQLAIAEFAAALLTIPKTLAINAAKDSTDLVAKLRAYHNAAQNAPVGDPKRGLMFYGLDLINGEVRDNVKAGVLEPTMSKIKSLKSALEAATSLLRIDDSITVGELILKAGVITACVRCLTSTSRYLQLQNKEAKRTLTGTRTNAGDVIPRPRL